MFWEFGSILYGVELRYDGRHLELVRYTGQSRIEASPLQICAASNDILLLIYVSVSIYKFLMSLLYNEFWGW